MNILVFEDLFSGKKTLYRNTNSEGHGILNENSTQETRIEVYIFLVHKNCLVRLFCVVSPLEALLFSIRNNGLT